MLSLCLEQNQQRLVLQVSADDRRHLCERTKLSSDVGLTAYGSVVYQLKDANMEASGTCDFVCRALRIVYKTSESRKNRYSSIETMMTKLYAGSFIST